MSGFIRRSEDVSFQGYVWHVATATFEAPDGEVFERSFVRSPGAVGVLPLWTNEDGSHDVTLVEQYRPPLDRTIIEIPAGMRDVPGEPTEETARRELIEEVGLTAGTFELLAAFNISPGLTDSRTFVYLATDLGVVERELHGPEEAHSAVLRMPFDAALEMVLDGRITDGKTVIGLLLADRRLRAAAG